MLILWSPGLVLSPIGWHVIPLTMRWKKYLRRTGFILMRELSRHCFRHKIDWRRLFLLGAFLTIYGLMFEILVHSHPPKKWFLSPLETASSYQSLSGNIQSNEFLKEERLQQVHLSLPIPVISPDSSDKFVQPVPVQPERVQTSQTKNFVSGRKRDKSLLIQ